MTPASVVGMAVGAAFFFALAEIAMRSALRFATPIMTAFLTIVVQWIVYTGLILATGEFSALNPSGLLWFSIAGVLNPFLFLTLYLFGIQQIGVARSAPVKGSAPIFAVIFAVGYLGERLGALQYLGIALVVGGILVISTEGLRGLGGEASPTPPEAARPRRIDFIFPLLAGMAGGVASVIFKVSMGKMPSPLLGVWIVSSEALLLFPLAAFLFPADQRFRAGRPAMPWIVLAGLSGSAAMYGFILSIGLGQVSIVFTLVQASPLFVLLMSVVFLRQLERVTWRVVAGAVLTVGGGVLVSLV